MNCSHFLVRGPVLALLLTLAAASVAQAQATLVTDKQNYSPGEIVHVTGSGWTPGETVALDFYRNDAQTPQVTYSETATEAGTIANHGFVIGEGDTNSSFAIDAKGAQSGLETQAWFLDGAYLTSLSVGAQQPSQPLHPGQTAQYTITAWCTTHWYWFWCYPNCGSATLAVTGLPRGVTAQLTQPSISFGGGMWGNSGNCGRGDAVLSLTVDATAPSNGTFTFWVYADGCGEQLYASGTIAIAAWNHAPQIDFIPDVALNEGTDLALAVHATDQEQPIQTLRYALTNAPGGARIDDATGLITWIPEESQGPGTYSFTVQVSDNADPPARSSASFRVYVNEVNRPPVMADVPDWTISECHPFAATLHATDPDVPANHLHYWLAPGAPNGLTVDPYTGVLGWTPTEAQGPGTYDVTIGVGDDGSSPLWDSRTCTITVEEVNLPPELTLPPLVTVHEGETASFQALATDPDLPANELTFSLADPVPAGAVIDAHSGVVSWSAADNVDVPFHVSVADGHGGLVTGDVTVTALNVPPSALITGPASGSLVAVGTPVTFTGTFTDPGAADTHTAEWTFDAMHVAGTVNEAAHTVQGTVTFSAAGVYAVRLAVADDDGGIGQATQVNGADAMIVVYDPSAGFATGGGWITSPAGAYAANPSVTGKANFGFVSKYLRGATMPTGETEFQFKEAGLDFHITSYDWMVVAGNKVQLKGVGTLNGGGSYGFLLTVIDGQPIDGIVIDRFRMKIMDRVTGVAIYDNQMGAADGDDPTTPLGGGAIVIHTTTGPNRLTGAMDSPLAGAGTLPASYALYANYPNPFRGSTTIGFALPGPGRVSLVVYDPAGRVVSRLAGGTWPAGWHEIPWSGNREDGRRAAAGVYFYRITVQSTNGGAPFSALQRMVLLR